MKPETLSPKNTLVLKFSVLDDSTAGELNQAFVFHSNIRKITMVYQFDGRKFVLFHAHMHVASVVAHPLIWRNKLEFDLETVSLAFESDSLSYSNTFASKLKYCIDQRKNRLENRDMDQLFSQFQAFPTLDEFQNSETLILEELTIGELTATKVSASVTKPTSVVEIAGLTTVDKDFAAEVSAIKTDLGKCIGNIQILVFSVSRGVYKYYMVWK